jgi:uncharacterized membrane protein YqjE
MIKDRVERLIQNLIGFLETRLELFKLEVKEEAIKLLSRVLLFVFLLLALTMLIIMGSFALGMYLNYVLESAYLGFLLVTLGYFVIFMGLILTKNAPFWRRIFYNMVDVENDKKHSDEHREPGSEEEKTA